MKAAMIQASSFVMALRLAVLVVLSMLLAPVLHAEGHPSWGYSGPGGPSDWSGLDERFQSCGLGKSQSPIDIRTRHVRKIGLKPIVFGYTESPAILANNGHTVQVNPVMPGHAEFDDISYRLLQFHFHTPSEERVDGKAYPLVAHFVHENAKGELAVVAVFFRTGRPNVALKPIFDEFPLRRGELRQLPVLLNVAALLPADQSYYAYTGSLTTPPCTEGVKWHVLKTPVEISPEQLSAFRKLYKHNARRVQPLNGRVVQAN
ncbi:carbonic anhydrase [Cupriavidus necator]